MSGFSSLRIITSSGAVIAGLAALASAFVQPAGGLVPSQLIDFQQAGSQPGDLSSVLQSSQICAGCHGFYDPTGEMAPYDRWVASMMAQAMRDPIFHAGLAIAEQDADFAGDLCLRCHSPNGWLGGRATPTDGSGLDPAQGDFDGVSCHFCHRNVDPVADAANPMEDTAILAGLTLPPGPDAHNGQYIVDPQDRRRGPFDLSTLPPPHPWLESPFHRESQLCATCHDVSNPLLSKQPDGSYDVNPHGMPHPTMAKDDAFPIERTFSEWANSVYAIDEIETNGRFGGDKTAVATCQDCHMPDTSGSACIQNEGTQNRPDLPQHDFNGANSWVLRAVRQLYPDFETGLNAQSVDESIARNISMLQRASDLEAYVVDGELVVRVVNMTGHKLPTGYGEGRRMWINVQFFDAAGTLLAERGHYDDIGADLTTTDTKVYEVIHGLDSDMSTATGLPVGPSFHFVLNNETLKDNRIPPRGYDEAAFAAIGAEVVGAHYEPEQYWDHTTYVLPAGAVDAEVRLFHQTTSKEYIEFLRNENTTNGAGDIAWNMWNMFGRSAPVLMGQADVDLAAPDCPTPIPYGLGKERTTGDRATLGTTGQASVSSANLSLEVRGAAPNAFGVYFSGGAAMNREYIGGWLLVQFPLMRSQVFQTNSQGEASVPIPVTPGMVGTSRYYQVIFRDVADPAALGLTNGVHIEFCD